MTTLTVAFQNFENEPKSLDQHVLMKQGNQASKYQFTYYIAPWKLLQWKNGWNSDNEWQFEISKKSGTVDLNIPN